MAFLQSDVGYLPTAQYKLVRFILTLIAMCTVSVCLSVQTLSGLSLSSKPDAETCINALTFLFKLE